MARTAGGKGERALLGCFGGGIDLSGSCWLFADIADGETWGMGMGTVYEVSVLAMVPHNLLDSYSSLAIWTLLTPGD